MKARTLIAAVCGIGAGALVWRREAIFDWLTDVTAGQPRGVLGRLYPDHELRTMLERAGFAGARVEAADDHSHGLLATARRPEGSATS